VEMDQQDQGARGLKAAARCFLRSLLLVAAVGEVTARLLAAVVGVVAAAEPRHRGLALQLAGLFPRQGKALQAVMARATTRPGALVAAAAVLALSVA
jgi:hypothetical protein